MAEPFDSAVYLEDVSAIIQTQYFREFTEETPGYFGSITNKLFKPDMEEITGDGKTMQVMVGRADTVRTQLNPIGDIASPDVFGANTLRVRFTRVNPTRANHDFTQVSASVQFDDLTIRNMSKGTIVDAADYTYNSVMKQYDERLAMLRHAGADCVIALVNGTGKKNDSYYYDGCSATPTNDAGIRLKIDNGSIAAFQPGTRWDFINPSNGQVVAGNVRVPDGDLPNPADMSVGFQFISSSASTLPARVSTGNVANIADNYYIVPSGSYNAGMYSLGAYFSAPTASESFIGGVDRTAAAYRWMIPTRMRQGSSAAKVTKSMFNDLAIAMGFREEDGQSAMVFMTGPSIHQSLRDEIGEDAFIQIPVGDDRAKRFMNFGSVGLNYQHGHFGVVKIAQDPLCPDNCVRVIDPETWKALFYGFRGLQPIRENGSHWYRLNAPTPNTGKSLIYKADWYGNQTDWCTKPWRNGIILNLTA